MNARLSPADRDAHGQIGEAEPRWLESVDGQLRWEDGGALRSLPRSELKRAWIEVQPDAVEIWAVLRDGSEVRLLSATPGSPEAELDRIRALLAAQDFRPQVRVAAGPPRDAAEIPDWARHATALARGAALEPGAHFIATRAAWLQRVVPGVIVGGPMLLMAWASERSGAAVGAGFAYLVFTIALMSLAGRLQSRHLSGLLPRRFNDGTYLLPEGVVVVARGVVQRYVPIADVIGVNLDFASAPAVRVRTDGGEQVIDFGVPRGRWVEVRMELRAWDTWRTGLTAAP